MTKPDDLEALAQRLDRLAWNCGDTLSTLHDDDAVISEAAAALREAGRYREALEEVRRIGTEPTARDNGPNYVANRMYHIADKALQDTRGSSHEP